MQCTNHKHKLVNSIGSDCKRIKEIARSREYRRVKKLSTADVTSHDNHLQQQSIVGNPSNAATITYFHIMLFNDEIIARFANRTLWLQSYMGIQFYNNKLNEYCRVCDRIWWSADVRIPSMGIV